MGSPESRKAYRDRMAQRGYELIELVLSDNPCQMCNEPDVDVLLFHHLDPNTKYYTVSALCHTGQSVYVILREVAKCAVLCHNCHTRLHKGKISQRELVPVNTSAYKEFKGGYRSQVAMATAL